MIILIKNIFWRWRRHLSGILSESPLPQTKFRLVSVRGRTKNISVRGCTKNILHTSGIRTPDSGVFISPSISLFGQEVSTSYWFLEVNEITTWSKYFWSKKLWTEHTWMENRKVFYTFADHYIFFHQNTRVTNFYELDLVLTIKTSYRVDVLKFY